MPQFNRADVIVFGVLVLCVPLQHYFVKHWGRTEPGRSYALSQFIEKLLKFHSEYLEWESWKKWCMTLIFNAEADQGSFYPVYPSEEDSEGQSPAVEVLKYKKKDGYFALSSEPRSSRPPDVKFRIGQVVAHKYWKYKGVIIGWDSSAKAPDNWLDTMHGKGNKIWRYMPNYAVLVDVRDRLTPQITYVPQENIDVIQYTKVLHPLVNELFEDFDGSQYIPRPWLKAVYPYD